MYLKHLPNQTHADRASAKEVAMRFERKRTARIPSDTIALRVAKASGDWASGHE